MALLAVATMVVATPQVDTFPGANNVYGHATYKADNPPTRYLGQFNETNDCISACLKYADAPKKPGETCNSFTHHLKNFPSNWAGLCFGIVDHSWAPPQDYTEPPIIVSGRVKWTEEPCGGSPATPRGCSWQVDPWCLAAGGLYAQHTMDTKSALAACAADAQCRGVSLADSGSGPSSDTPVEHSFYNSTGGGYGGCWAYRRHFELATDPFRTKFHYQPTANWMNDPNGPMYFRGVSHLFYRAYWVPGSAPPACVPAWT
jgi:hypothetical protein